MQMVGTTRLGPKRELTREGYLVCRDVPITRTGDMLYARGTIRDAEGNEAVTADERGVIRVTRTADVLFSAETMNSVFGKPVTIHHPAGNVVMPGNYLAVAKGTLSNPHRGSGSQDDKLLADITFFDQASIDAIQRGDFGPNPEVSAGMDSGFSQTAPGHAKAEKITFNHVAVVPKGRCGPACAIGDSVMPLNELLARLRAALTGGNTADAEAAIVEIETSHGATLDVNDLALRLTAIEARVPADVLPSAGITADAAAIRTAVTEAIAPLALRLSAIETAERDRSAAITAEATRRAAAAVTADAAMVALYPVTRIADLAASTEILAPGFRPSVPMVATGTTADCASAMCGCQRGALAASYATDAGKKAIDVVLAGRSADFASMDAITVDTIFNASAAIRAAQNNAGGNVNGKPAGYVAPMSANDRLKAGVAKFNAPA